MLKNIWPFEYTVRALPGLQRDLCKWGPWGVCSISSVANTPRSFGVIQMWVWILTPPLSSCEGVEEAKISLSVYLFLELYIKSDAGLYVTGIFRYWGYVCKKLSKALDTSPQDRQCDKQDRLKSALGGRSTLPFMLRCTDNRSQTLVEGSHRVESCHWTAPTRLLRHQVTTSFCCHRQAWQAPGCLLTLTSWWLTYNPQLSCHSPSHKSSSDSAQLHSRAYGSQEEKEGTVVAPLPGRQDFPDSRGPWVDRVDLAVLIKSCLFPGGWGFATQPASDTECCPSLS